MGGCAREGEAWPPLTCLPTVSTHSKAMGLSPSMWRRLQVQKWPSEWGPPLTHLLRLCLHLHHGLCKMYRDCSTWANEREAGLSFVCLAITTAMCSEAMEQFIIPELGLKVVVLKAKNEIFSIILDIINNSATQLKSVVWVPTRCKTQCNQNGCIDLGMAPFGR